MRGAKTAGALRQHASRLTLLGKEAKAKAADAVTGLRTAAAALDAVEQQAAELARREQLLKSAIDAVTTEGRLQLLYSGRALRPAQLARLVRYHQASRFFLEEAAAAQLRAAHRRARSREALDAQQRALQALRCRADRYHDAARRLSAKLPLLAELLEGTECEEQRAAAGQHARRGGDPRAGSPL